MLRGVLLMKGICFTGACSGPKTGHSVTTPGLRRVLALRAPGLRRVLALRKLLPKNVFSGAPGHLFYGVSCYDVSFSWPRLAKAFELARLGWLAFGVVFESFLDRLISERFGPLSDRFGPL